MRTGKFSRLLEDREHVSPHRLWAYINGEVCLSLAESGHTLACDRCQEVVIACLQAETFGEALKNLGYEDEEKSA
jgi:hypothetical protein